MSLQHGVKPGDECPMWKTDTAPYSVYWQSAETGLLFFRAGCWPDPFQAQYQVDYYERFFPEPGGVHVVVDDRSMTPLPKGSFRYVYRDGRQTLVTSVA